MNRTTLAVLLAVLLGASLVLATAPAFAGVTGNPVITLSAPDSTVSPGQVATLGVSVLNAGHVENGSSRNPADERRVTTARGLTLTVRSGDAPIDVRTGPTAVGSVPEGSVGPVPFEIEVAEDAEPGTYDVPVTVEYVYTSEITRENGTEVHEESSVRRTTTVSLTVRERARFAVVNASTDAAAGEDGRLSVAIENVGDRAVDGATVDVQSPNAALTFGGAPTARTFVGTWEPGETRRVTVEARFAPGARQRRYAVDATVAYDRDGRRIQAEPLPFGVVPDDGQAFGLGNVNSTLQVGSEGRLSGTLHNRGPDAVENAVLVLEPSGGTPGGSRSATSSSGSATSASGSVTSASGSVTTSETEYALGDLEPGESVPFAYDLDVSSSAREGPRQFTFRVRYEADQGTTTSDPLFARATVGPRRDAVAVEPIESEMRAGSDARFVVEVTNTAGEPLADVSAKLFADDPISARDDEAFVDSLAPGESTRMVFEVAAGGDAIPKAYPVSLDFQYTEPDGDTKLSDTHRVPVTVTDDGGGLLPFAVGSITLGGLGIGFVWRLR